MLPTQRAGAESLQPPFRRLKRIMGEWLGIDPAEEVVHDRISHYHDVSDFGPLLSRRKKQLFNECANLLTDQCLELVLSTPQHGEVQPAHHVGAETRLGVQRGAYRQHPTGG